MKVFEWGPIAPVLILRKPSKISPLPLTASLRFYGNLFKLIVQAHITVQLNPARQQLIKQHIPSYENFMKITDLRTHFGGISIKTAERRRLECQRAKERICMLMNWKIYSSRHPTSSRCCLESRVIKPSWLLCDRLCSETTTKHASKSEQSEQWIKYLLKFVQWSFVGVGCLHSLLSFTRAKFNPIYAFINIYENCLISHKSFSLEAAITNGELENISPSTWEVFFA